MIEICFVLHLTWNVLFAKMSVLAMTSPEFFSSLSPCNQREEKKRSCGSRCGCCCWCCCCCCWCCWSPHESRKWFTDFKLVSIIFSSFKIQKCGMFEFARLSEQKWLIFQYTAGRSSQFSLKMDAELCIITQIMNPKDLTLLTNRGSHQRQSKKSHRRPGFESQIDWPI